VRSSFSLQGKQAVAFERFMAFRKSGGNHCHINVVPVPASAAETARATFDRAAAAIGAEFTELPRSSGEVGPETIAVAFLGCLTSNGAAVGNEGQKPNQNRTPAAFLGLPKSDGAAFCSGDPNADQDWTAAATSNCGASWDTAAAVYGRLHEVLAGS
jgi:hypothetical protein